MHKMENNETMDDSSSGCGLDDHSRPNFLRLTRREVSSHSSKDNCWVIIHGEVFDITEFLSEHPGGSSVLLQCAGKDATECFDRVGHGVSPSVKRWLDRFRIGIVVNDDERRKERRMKNNRKLKKGSESYSLKNSLKWIIPTVAAVVLFTLYRKKLRH